MERVIIRGEHRDTRFEPPRGQQVWFRDARLIGVDFSRTRFDYFFSTGSVFERCDFSGAHLEGDFGRGSTFVDCRFDWTNVLHVHPGISRFERGLFRELTIKKWLATCAEFVDCVFAARIESTKFFGRPFGPCTRSAKRAVNEFRGNDFREASLIDTSFVLGIDIAAQRWPASNTYVRLDHIHDRITVARTGVAGWGDPSERREAEIMLNVYSKDMEEQRELFARRDELSNVPPTIRNRVWTLLEEAL